MSTNWLDAVMPLVGVALGAVLTRWGTRTQDKRRGRVAAVRIIAKFERLTWPEIGRVTEGDLIDLRVALAEAGVRDPVFRAVDAAAKECLIMHNALRAAHGDRLHPSRFPRSLWRLGNLVSLILNLEVRHPLKARLQRKKLILHLIANTDELRGERLQLMSEGDDEIGDSSI